MSGLAWMARLKEFADSRVLTFDQMTRLAATRSGRRARKAFADGASWNVVHQWLSKAATELKTVRRLRRAAR